MSVMQKRILRMTYGLETNYSIEYGMKGAVELCSSLLQYVQIVKTTKGRGKTRKVFDYYNVSCSFDTETSSFKINGKKYACMYIWQFCIFLNVPNHKPEYLTIYGRTWEQFVEFMANIVMYLKLNYKRRLVIYVHNLSFDFQFFRKLFDYTMVFSLKNRVPVTATTTVGIEFRCSYKLSNMSLALIGKNLQKYKIEKAVGDLDYNLIRHSKTPLTEKELGYCIRDVQCACSYIQERMDEDGDITKIPQTNTGYVRRACREKCFENRDNYSKLMHSLVITDINILKKERMAFQGGFTHASVLHADSVLNNVASYDIGSAYPTNCLAYKFPMDSGKKIENPTMKQLDYYMKRFACLITMELRNVSNIEKFPYESYLSSSRCTCLENAVIDNGRVRKADKIRICITEQDWNIIKRVYNFDKVYIKDIIIFKRDYLPKPIIECILDFYKGKTTLKGLEEYTREYLIKKGMLNSIYGMAVTNFIRDIVKYQEDGWNVEEPCIEDELEKYNNDDNRFLYWTWGLWITAYTRMRLFKFIFFLEKKYVYSDTDSVKYLYENGSARSDFINKLESMGYNYKELVKKYNDKNPVNIFIKLENDDIVRRIEKCLDYYHIDKNEIRPKDKHGIEHVLGIWDFEGVYKKFKTLGAKRYMVEKYKHNKHKFDLTVAGLNGTMAIGYMLDQAKENKCSVFDIFTDDMTIPAQYSGRIVHTYIDEPTSGVVTDYLGNTCEFSELSSIYLEESEYNLGLANEYVELLADINEIE